MADLAALAEALIAGDRNKVVELTNQALEEGVSPKDILEKVLIVSYLRMLLCVLDNLLQIWF
ncbi:hypothetical protein LCGC14_2753950 [marine sediment metagenome]|uniref:B12-binding N-terminal domain-containing protein n=1 Tax=marine sediment metagenome TaxID=412755 RepID=A0A0F9B9M3_9ZZZZ